MIPSHIIGPSRRHLCPAPSVRYAPLSSFPAAAPSLGAISQSWRTLGIGPRDASVRSVSRLLSGVAWLVSVSAAFVGSMMTRRTDKRDEDFSEKLACACSGGVM